jgi:hypothetical protein
MSNSRIVRIATLLAPCVLLAASSTHAQRTPAPRTPPRIETDQRWLSWLGCWQAENETTPLVCFAPVAGTRGVDRITIDGSNVVARERLIADSVSRRFTRDGCRGIETGEWSKSGRQLFLRAEFTCADSLDGRSVTLLAFSPDGEWVESMQLRAARGTLERSTRYRDAGLPGVVPKDVAAAIRSKSLAIATARAASSAPVTTEEVSEATSTVGDEVVRPWLVARGEVSEAAPQRTEQAQAVTVAPNAQDVACRTVVCYSPHPYSTYNGAPAQPYPSYLYGAYGSYYGYFPMISSYWVPAPLVVIGGSSRKPVRREQPTIRLHDDDRRPPMARPREAQPSPRSNAQPRATNVIQARRRN